MSQQQKPSKILLLGDSCYDYYHYGKVNRISPEAPIPIFDFDYVQKKMGMASNVYENLKALGVDVHIMTSFNENKRRYIDLKSGQQLLRVDEKINEEFYDDAFAPLYYDYDAIVISDYNKGYLDYNNVIEIRNNYDGPMFIDTKKRDLAKFKNMYIKINEHEYSLAESYPDDMDMLITTKGAKEVQWGNRIYHPPKVETHDVCGAGDTFLAALAYEYLQSNDMDFAIIFAMKAAAITVQKTGVYAPTLEEIE